MTDYGKGAPLDYLVCVFDKPVPSFMRKCVKTTIELGVWFYEMKFRDLKHSPTNGK